MIIYKIGGIHRAPKGLKYSYREIEDGSEVAKGWYDCLNDAVSAELNPVQELTPPEKMAITKAKNKAAKEAKEAAQKESE